MDKSKNQKTLLDSEIIRTSAEYFLFHNILFVFIIIFNKVKFQMA